MTSQPSQIDPLNLLRHFIINKKEYIEEGDKIIFGDVFYPKDAKTNYLVYGTGKNNQAKEYYNLECLVYFVKNIDSPHAIYIKNATNQTKQIQVVPRPDRKDLLNYLFGETDTNASIDKNAPLEITVQQPIPISKLPKRANQQDLGQDAAFKKQKINDDTTNAANMTQFRERILKRFDNTDKPTRITENITSELSTVLPIEKLTSIKAKILAKKREQISVENDEELIQQATHTSIGDVIDSDLSKEILNRERVWRNRTTILESNGKSFDANIFAILQSIKTKEDVASTQLTNSQLNANDNLSLNNPLANDMTNVLSMQLSSSQQASSQLSQSQQNLKTRALNYSRFDQERYGPKDDTGGFSIDTKRSYQFNGAISLNEPTQPLAKQQNNFTQRPSSQQPGSKAIPGAINTTTSSQKRAAMRPIIVVPASRTSIITLYNAIDILQDLKYVPSEEKRKNLQNITKDSEIIMRRKEDGKTLQYKIIDNVSKLNREDWDRVVAVFAHGPSWQFKDWPWDGNPAEIFNKVKAFHLKWSGINLDGNIGKWSVSIIELDQNKRHLDRARLLTFWDELDKYVEKLATTKL